MESLLAEEKGTMAVQNSPFCRRLRIEEPILKKSNTTKAVSRCLFGIPDPVECKNFANNANELNILQFKNRWCFDPTTSAPVDFNPDVTMVAENIDEFKHDFQIYKWEKVFNEEVIQHVSEKPVDANTQRVESPVLQITPASEVRAPEVTSLASTDTSVLTTTEALDITMTEDAAELLETSHEDAHNSSTGTVSNSSMETLSPPREKKFKSSKSMRQCIITDYMPVIKKPRAAKKLR